MKLIWSKSLSLLLRVAFLAKPNQMKPGQKLSSHLIKTLSFHIDPMIVPKNKTDVL